MNLITKIKDDQLAARKERNGLKTALLTTLLGEASMVGKNANRETTDAEVQAVIKKFIKGIDATIEFLPKDGSAKHSLEAVQYEKEILEAYLPQQFSAVKIQACLERIPAFDNKGVMMKYMKDNFADQYDGKLAAQVIDKMLAK